MKARKTYINKFSILIIIIISILWIPFVILYINHPWEELGNYIAIATALTAFTGTIISLIASEKRTEKQLLSQEKNIMKQLRSDRKEKAYLELFRVFYNESIAVFDRGYSIDRLNGELEDFLISRKNLCEFLLEFENKNDGFFYLDNNLMIDLITVNETIKYNKKYKDLEKRYFVEIKGKISSMEELNELLMRDAVGNYLKEIKKKLEEYRGGNFPLVFVPIIENDYKFK